MFCSIRTLILVFFALTSTVVESRLSAGNFPNDVHIIERGDDYKPSLTSNRNETAVSLFLWSCIDKRKAKFTDYQTTINNPNDVMS